MSRPVRIDLDPTTESTTAVEEPPAPPPPKARAATKALPSEPAPTAPTGGDDADDLSICMLPLGRVVADPDQPRREFDLHALESLAASIKANGLMQPIVVRPLGDRFQIVAGERRWRAAGMLELAAIPAIVRDLDEGRAAELSLVENLQREDLNPIERAEAFRRLADEFGLGHQEIADRVGLDRSTVTNHLRLNDLDETSRDALRSGELTMGHGRALLAITNNAERASMARATIRQGWSVRELERRVRAHAQRAARAEAPVAAKPLSRVEAQMRDLEAGLGAHLGTKVAISPGRKKGTGSVQISFFSLDEFEGLLQRLGYRPE